MKGNCKRVYWMWLPHYISWLPLWRDNNSQRQRRRLELSWISNFSQMQQPPKGRLCNIYIFFPPCGENSASVINFSASKGSQQQQQLQRRETITRCCWLLAGKFIRNFNTIVKLWTITYGYFSSVTTTS